MTDVLEMEVRHKWNAERPSVSHFLGKISFPVSQCLNQDHSTQSVAGSFQIRNTVEPLNKGHAWDPFVERLSSFGGHFLHGVYRKVFLDCP